MKLYSNPYSPNCRKVHGVIAQIGSEVEMQTVNLQEGEQKKPEFLELNPNGRVPVLVDGDTTLWESNSIGCYVAGKAESDLWPRSDQRYDILRWMFWECVHWAPAIGTVIGQKIFNADNPDQAIIDKGITDFRHCASILNGQLESHSHVSGESLTVADFSVGVWLGYAPVLDLPVSEFGNVERWYQTLSDLPAWKEVMPPSPG